MNKWIESKVFLWISKDLNKNINLFEFNNSFLSEWNARITKHRDKIIHRFAASRVLYLFWQLFDALLCRPVIKMGEKRGEDRASRTSRLWNKNKIKYRGERKVFFLKISQPLKRKRILAIFNFFIFLNACR